MSSVVINNIVHCLSTQASCMIGFKTKLIAVNIVNTLIIKTLFDTL